MPPAPQSPRSPAVRRAALMALLGAFLLLNPEAVGAQNQPPGDAPSATVTELPPAEKLRLTLSQSDYRAISQYLTLPPAERLAALQHLQAHPGAELTRIEYLRTLLRLARPGAAPGAATPAPADTPTGAPTTGPAAPATAAGGKPRPADRPLPPTPPDTPQMAPTAPAAPPASPAAPAATSSELAQLAAQLDELARRLETRRLVNNLGAKRYADRAAATTALQQLGRAAVEDLTWGLNSPDPEVAAACLELLVNIRGRGYIGISFVILPPALTAAEAAAKGLPFVGGVEVDMVQDGLPGANAGLKQGDIIIGLGPLRIVTWSDLLRAVDHFGPETPTTITVVREGKPQTLPLTLATRPGNIN